jgi:hypothetical protein
MRYYNSESGGTINSLENTHLLSASLLYISFEGINEKTEAYTVVSFTFVKGKCHDSLKLTARNWLLSGNFVES